MSILSKLSPEQKEQAKSCKSEAELKEYLEGCGALTVDELDSVAGGVGAETPGCPHPEWGRVFCYDCPAELHCWAAEDPRDDVTPENISRAFARGEISGAGFFA